MGSTIMMPGVQFPKGVHQQAPASTFHTHEVRRGESLSLIAARHGTTWQELFRANRDQIVNPDLIFPGQRLRVPCPVQGMPTTSGKGEHGSRKAPGQAPGQHPLLPKMPSMNPLRPPHQGPHQRPHQGPSQGVQGAHGTRGSHLPPSPPALDTSPGRLPSRQQPPVPSDSDLPPALPRGERGVVAPRTGAPRTDGPRTDGPRTDGPRMAPMPIIVPGPNSPRMAPMPTFVPPANGVRPVPMPEVQLPNPALEGWRTIEV